jgi:hypothetical protein
MPCDTDQLQFIKNQTLALIAELTANPKPSYRVEGQTVSWNAYLAQLRETVDWCEKKIAAQEVFEVRSQGGS